MSSKYSKYLVYYNNYQEIYTRPLGYFDPLVEEILKFSEKKEICILDIGCGFGDLLFSFYTKLGEKSRYYGLTIARHEFEFIQKNRPFIKITLGRQQDLLKFFANKKFDIVINFHTLSYIPQNLQLDVTKQMISILKDNGLLILAYIEDWIKTSFKIKQGGEGYVQFYYSPWIYSTLDQYCSRIFVKKSRENYLIEFWRKDKNKKIGTKGFILSMFYIIRNNLLFINYLSRLIKKIL